MTYLMVLFAILAFVFYYKAWGKEDFKRFSKATFGFGKSMREGMYEQRISELKQELNYYVIALLAKIAKSDGKISEHEASVIRQVLDANVSDANERAFLAHTFNEEKQNLENAYDIASNLVVNIPLHPKQRENLLMLFVSLARMDGLNTKKRYILDDICEAFGCSKERLDELLRGPKSSTNKKSMNTNDAYMTLGLQPGCTLSELKKAYRTLVKKYHPDILNAHKASKEELEAGIKRFGEINEAYEELKKIIKN